MLEIVFLLEAVTSIEVFKLKNDVSQGRRKVYTGRTSQLWNSLPPTTFPESYNLSSFKSNINKLDLVSLST